MRTVVTVSEAELARMAGVMVLGRPENQGRCVGGIEAEHPVGGPSVMRVIVFDTLEEANEYLAAQTPASAKAPVLQLVTPAAAERIRCGDYARLKSGGPAMHVVMEDCTSGPSRGELHCVWPGENGEMSHGSFKPEMLELAPLRAFDERCDAS